jgi:hypothetical protein
LTASFLRFLVPSRQKQWLPGPNHYRACQTNKSSRAIERDAAEQGISSVTSILVRRTGAFGDVIDVTPVARRLRNENPDAEIDVDTQYPSSFSAATMSAPHGAGMATNTKSATAAFHCVRAA